MRKYLLPQRGNFYKGNMHCHSVLSDGSCTPQELKELYKSKGYSVLAITDHEGLFYHPELDDSDFLTIAGYELEYNEMHGDDFDDAIVAHFCIYKKDPSNIYQLGFDQNYNHPKFKWLHNEWRARMRTKGEIIPKDHSPENLNKMIKRFRDGGFLVTYNHPKWSQEDYSVYSKYTGMNCMEIYNHGCWVAGHDEHNGEVYDVLLRKGERIHCVAADDNHHSADHMPCHDMFGGFTMFKAESLTYENIIKAFENGDFYSSTGPEIEEIYAEDGVFTVKASTPVDYIRFLTGHRRVGRVFSPDGERVTEGSFKFTPADKYVRAELVRNDGTVAYTQAYFIDEM